MALARFAGSNNSDTPAAIAIAEGLQSTFTYIAIAGKSSVAGWAVAAISANSGTILWQNTFVSGSSIAGQANGVTLGDCDTGFITAVGTDATQSHMVIAQFSGPTGVLNTGFGDSDGQSGQTGKVIVPNVIPGYPGRYVNNAVANTIYEPEHNLMEEGFVIGGNESFCTGSNPSTGSDMVLVALTASGNYVSTFGSNGMVATNIAYGGGAGTSCSAANPPSVDSDYSLVDTYVVTNDTQNEYVTAVGSSYVQYGNGQTGSPLFSVERFHLEDGMLDTAGFGPLVTGSTTVHTGFALGPPGTGFGAVLNDSVDHPNAIIAVGGGTNNFIAARFKFDGSLDTTFGTNGVIGNTDFGASNGANTVDSARSVFILPDGSVVVGGYDYTTGTNGQIALADLLDKNKVRVF